MSAPIPGAPRWVALLRMARRQVRRNRLRSVLILALVALPVATVSLADVLARSNPLDARQRAESLLGNADALVQYAGPGPLLQTPSWPFAQLNQGTGPGPAPGSPGQQQPPTIAQLRSWLPGSTLIQANPVRKVLLKTRAGATSIELTGVDLTVAATRPPLTVVAGSWSAGRGELSLGEDLARSAGLAVGDTVTLRQPPATLTLVAVLHDRYQNLSRFAAVSPATMAALPGGPRSSEPVTSWTVVRPGGVSWADTVALNEHGLMVTSRAVLLDPPPRSAVPYYQYMRQQFGSLAGTGRIAVTIGVGVGLAILQLVLLAGPAFAVSGRQRQHDMALIAAIGGDRKILRRTLLAESLVLGALAGVLGCALGIAAAVAYRSWHAGVLGPLRLPPGELAGIAVLGLLSAVAGGLLPAHWAARLDVVAALAGRRGATRTPWRLSLLGLLSVAAGLAAGAAGAARGELLLILPGLALCELGVVALTPGILSLAGRLAPRLPVAFRIALRDAARNRSAAVPALAAVLAVTTASIAIAIYVSSQSARDRLQYQPQLPAGLVLVRLPDDRPDAASLAVQALRANLDVSRVAVLSSNNCANCMDLQVVRPAANQCPPEATSRSDPRCQYQEATGYGFGGVVMEPELLGVLMDRLDPADVAALEAGKLLVGSALDLDESGQVTVVQRVYGEADPAPTRGLPAAVRRSSTRLGIAVLMSPATAAKLHVQTAPTAVVAALASPVTDQQEQSLVAALADNDLTATIEHGYVDRYRAAILATLLAAVIIAMGATALATALAVVDSRPDLLTLWAVGASPGLRRRLSVARAGVVALLGVLLGTALGFLPPIMVIDNARRSNHGYGSLPPDPHPLAIPWWPNVIGTVMLVPLAAMLIAGLMTRTRPPEPLRTDA